MGRTDKGWNFRLVVKNFTYKTKDVIIFRGRGDDSILKAMAMYLFQVPADGYHCELKVTPPTPRMGQGCVLCLRIDPLRFLDVVGGD